MLDLDRASLLEEPAPDLQKTAGTIEDHDVRTRPLDRRNLAVEDLAGDLRVVGRKVPAKAAAFSDVVELPQLVAGKHSEETALWLLNPETSQGAAGIVVRHCHLLTGGFSERPVSKADNLDQILREVLGPSRNGSSPPLPRGVFLDQFGDVLL